jgi:AraC-like DNA-binding protein
LYDHELVYVLGGRGRIVIERTSYEAREDQLFLIPPRVWHAFVADDGHKFPLMGVHFDWEVRHDTLAFPLFRPADEPVEEARFRPFHEVPGWNWCAQPFLNLKGRPGTRRLLEQIVTEYSRQNEHSPLVAGAMLAALLALVSHEAQVLEQLQQSDRIGADALRRIERARGLLEGEQVLGVEEVAARVGWSGDHMRKMFRAAGLSNPTHLQTAARMKRAREMLRDENLPIGEVGRLCGFEDASHFARVFKADSGLTPRQFLALAKKI